MRDREEALKLCLNCHAQVDKDVLICPYCRTSFSENPFSSSSSFSRPAGSNSLSVEESISSLYPPPYQPKVETVPEESLNVEEEGDVQVEKIDSGFSMVWPNVLCALGTYLFLFGLFLGLFSTEGYLSLRFSSSFWYLYFLASVPLLAISYKMLSKLK